MGRALLAASEQRPRKLLNVLQRILRTAPRTKSHPALNANAPRIRSSALGEKTVGDKEFNSELRSSST